MHFYALLTSFSSEFNARNFKPRAEIIKEMSAKAKAKGVEEANSLFD